MNVYNTVLMEFEEFISLAELTDTDIAKLRGPSFKLPARTFASWCRFARGVIGEVRQIQVRRIFFEPAAPSIIIKSGDFTTNTVTGFINTLVFQTDSINVVGPIAYYTPHLTVRTLSGNPTGSAKTLVFPNNSLSFNTAGDVATITFPSGGGGGGGGTSNPEFQWSLSSPVGETPVVINIASGRAIVDPRGDHLDYYPGTLRPIAASIRTFTADGTYCVVVDTADLSAEQYYEASGVLRADPNLDDLTPEWPDYGTRHIQWWKRLERVPIWILKVETISGITTVTQIRDLRPTGSEPFLRFFLTHQGEAVQNLQTLSTELANSVYTLTQSPQWRGEWSSVKTFKYDDLTWYGGVFYRAKGVSTNQAPPNPTYWDVYSAGSGTAPSVAVINNYSNVVTYGLHETVVDPSTLRQSRSLLNPNTGNALSSTGAWQDISQDGILIKTVDNATNGAIKTLELPNGTLSIAGTVATYTPTTSGGGASLTVEEVDGAPTGVATTLRFPNGTLTNSSGVFTYTPSSAVVQSEFTLGFGGVPTASQVDFLPMVRAGNIATTGHVAISEVAATASTTYNIRKNGTVVGTAVWGASATTGTATLSSTTSHTAGDKYTLTAPATPDTTHSNIRVTFLVTN